MKLMSIAVLVLAALPAHAAEITGHLLITGKVTGVVRVGYAAITSSGESISNMAGVTMSASRSRAWCDTYKPRRTGISLDSEKGHTFEHTNIPPGRYLMYAMAGERYFAWRIVNVPSTSTRLVVEMSLTLGAVGNIRFTRGKTRGPLNVRLSPLDKRNRPPLPGIKDYMSVGVDEDLDGKTLDFAGMRPGSYRADVRTVTRLGSDGSTKLYKDVGSYSVQVRVGRLTLYSLP